MTEFYNTAPLNHELNCGDVRITIEDPEATMTTIAESNFDMHLVTRCYSNGELSDVIASDLFLKFDQDSQEKSIEGEIWMNGNPLSLISKSRLLDTVHGLVEEKYYDSKHVDFKGGSHATVFIETGTYARIEISEKEQNRQVLHLKVPIIPDQSTEDNYNDVLAVLQLWANIQDVISITPHSQDELDDPSEVVEIHISDPRNILPKDDELYSFWQKFLSATSRYDDFQRDMDCVALPKIAHKHIDFALLKKVFDNTGMTLIEDVIEQAIKKGQDHYRKTGKTALISGADLYEASENLRKSQD